MSQEVTVTGSQSYVEGSGPGDMVLVFFNKEDGSAQYNFGKKISEYIRRSVSGRTWLKFNFDSICF